MNGRDYSNCEFGEEVKSLSQEIMELLRKRKDMPYEYINPHFLASIAGDLRDYGKLEDDDVWDWIQGMYSA